MIVMLPDLLLHISNLQCIISQEHGGKFNFAIHDATGRIGDRRMPQVPLAEPQ